ncbi:MAG: MarR family transcriptional regulator [Pseudomonadota bacterium]
MAPSAQALRRFRLIFNAVKTHFREVEKKAGLAGAQLWALSVVHEAPGIGVGELAIKMDVHQSTASNLLKALVAAGLVQVERTPADQRSRALFVTPAGLKVLKRAPGPFAGVLPEALASLDAPTLARLNRDLDSVIEALKVDARAANIPLGQPDA